MPAEKYRLLSAHHCDSILVRNSASLFADPERKEISYFIVKKYEEILFFFPHLWYTQIEVLEGSSQCCEIIVYENISDSTQRQRPTT